MPRIVVRVRTMKRVNPYDRLKKQLNEEWNKVEHRHTVPMHFYPNAKKGGSWSLADLAHKVDAAAQLGYDVFLSNSDDGLHVKYIKKIPPRPFVLTY